ncbi:MAG: DUF4831 family protein [Bacteroidaceae bacterium]|nr:DUF4831 family protein [Bacteroidaceae bacterium]
MKKLLLLACAVVGVCINSMAQTEVRPFQPGVTESGISYFLPQTKIQVVVTAERTIAYPGEFSMYAEKFLRLKNVVHGKTETWKVKTIELSTFGEANPQLAFSITHNIKSLVPLVRLAPDGRLLAINCEAPELDKPAQASVEKLTSAPTDAAQYKTHEMLSAGSQIKMAELAAAEIYDIRENRALLAKGQADFMPTDGQQLKLMLESLDKQEQGLLRLFEGTTETELHTFVFNYTPSAADVKSDVLFRFSNKLGMVDVDDLAGQPYYIDITDMKSLPEVVSTPQVEDSKSLFKKRKNKEENLDLRYMLPGKAMVKVYDHQNVLTQVEFLMSQFGRVENMGGELFNPKMQTSVLLSPITGALEKIDYIKPEKK